MKYNRPHATAAWGTMAKDWELGVDYQHMVNERSFDAHRQPSRRPGSVERCVSTSITCAM